MSKMRIWSIFKGLKNKKRGGPILEEILLIGIAILVFAFALGLVLSLIDWTKLSIGDLFP